MRFFAVIAFYLWSDISAKIKAVIGLCLLNMLKMAMPIMLVL